MECQNCELRQRQFYCESCLKQHLLQYRLQSGHLTAERDAHISAAHKSLTAVIEPARIRRADLRGSEEKVREIWEGLEADRKANEHARQRIRELRESLASRRRTLAIATSLPVSHPNSNASSTSPPHHMQMQTQMPGSLPLPVAPTSNTSLASSSSRPGMHTRRMSNTSLSRTVETPSSNSRPPSNLTSRASGVSTSPQSVRSQLSGSPHMAGYQSRFDKDREKNSAGGDPNLARQIEEATFHLSILSDTLARARSGLVQELVEVFSVVEVGGRPPLGGKAGTKGEWTIGGLVLPVPGDMRRYPPDHINAVVTHTLHFLSLLSFYLGIKLPFEVIWSRSSTPPSTSLATSITTLPSHHSSSPSPAATIRGLLGVGTPWIGAIRGSENGGWARWSTKHPLHVSSTSLPSSSPPSPSTISNRPSSTPTVRPALSLHGRSASTPISPPLQSPSPTSISGSTLADSHYEETSSTSASGSSFTTALSMLLYNVTYLAYTQSVEIPLAQAGEVLGNLWAVCCSSDLGKKSHEALPYLPAPTPSSFPLDFTQLLQATSMNPSRARARVIGGVHTATTSLSRRERDRERERRDRERDRIVEEDEGWDLVDVDV
ncbi:UV radiation resistance protein and autophagy-related subunit 14-domain-containing protein [Abortiporus biennis]|nr:UV radiation resistance protein and autophagy-related subunit 14-domain-containing protein [Abortiporus biennis]